VDDLDQFTPELSELQVEFRKRQVEFCNDLSRELLKNFGRTWIPRLAENACREIESSPPEKKAAKFREHLDVAFKWILEMQELLIRHLAGYVTAKNREFSGNERAWIDSRLEEIWHAVFTIKAYRGWIASACDRGDSPSEWLAPAWLQQWDDQSRIALASMKRGMATGEHRVAGGLPAQIVRESTALHKSRVAELTERLDEQQTAALVGRIYGVLEIWRARVKSECVSATNVRLCEENPLPGGLFEAKSMPAIQTPKPHGPEGPKPSDVEGVIKLTDREKNIWLVIQRGARGRQYARELDNAEIAPPKVGVWKDGPRKYLAAYNLGGRWPHRIEDEKSKITRKAKKLASALAGE